MTDTKPSAMEKWLRKQKKEQLIAICLELNRERNMYRQNLIDWATVEE